MIVFFGILRKSVESLLETMKTTTAKQVMDKASRTTKKVKDITKQHKKMKQAVEDAAKAFDDLPIEGLPETSEGRRLEAVEKIRQVIKTGDWESRRNSYEIWYQFGRWRVEGRGFPICIQFRKEYIQFLTDAEKEELKDLFNKRREEQQKEFMIKTKAAQIDQLLNGEPRTWIDRIFFFLGYSRI